MRSGSGSRLAAASFAICALLLATGSAGAETITKPVPRPGETSVAAGTPGTVGKQVFRKIDPNRKYTITYDRGHVYVFRGLANVFSRGMDKLTMDLQDLGVPVTLANHSHWRKYADDIIARYKTDQSMIPLIIVGHSLGADAAMVMSSWLSQNRVPVRLVISFDPVAAAHPVAPSVAEVINYYKPKSYGREVVGSKHFKGSITNIDLTKRPDIDHLNIDKDPVLHQKTIDEILQILKDAEKTGKKKGSEG